MQSSKNTEYFHNPEWYYGIEYVKEQERGYDYKEDLMVPGHFEFPVKKGESVIFSAGTNIADTPSLKRFYSSELKTRVPRDSFIHCLENAAQQFINKWNGHVEIIAGYPWLSGAGRDTFVAIPGLLLSTDNVKIFEAVVDTMVGEMRGPFFPEKFTSKGFTHEAADTPLWFFYALQKLSAHSGKPDAIWKKYGAVMKMILSEYRKGTSFDIHMTENGLLHTGNAGTALTWMDVKTGGVPLTPRNGYAVEVNALWYNAVLFALELAGKAKEKEFITEWAPIAEMIPASFTQVFWDESKGYLADFVNENGADWSVRPNMVFAVSLPHSPVPAKIANAVMHIIEKELLTRRGLRSLSPKDQRYKGTYSGAPEERDLAYHMGTAFPWLLGHFVEAYMKSHGREGVAFAEKLFLGFESEMTNHGIGTISEVFDGDPPHEAKGCISQAWNVSELLRINEMIRKYEKK